MNFPGDVSKLVSLAKKMAPEQEITNDQVISMLGGTDAIWGAYLRGPRVSAAIHKTNLELMSADRSLSSQGIGSERWVVVSVSEGQRRLAVQRINRADAHVKNAVDAVMNVLQDPRSPKRHKEWARAWMDLFLENDLQQDFITFKQWADELLRLPAPVLVASKAGALQ